MGKKHKISIVIPVWNKFNFTQACLKDLASLPDYCEVVVVDNGSTDQTHRELSGYNNILYLRNDQNEGFAKGCNRGYRESSGESVLFLNNDIRVKSRRDSWVDDLIDAIDKENDVLVGPTGGLVSETFDFVYETNDESRPINYMSGWCLGASKNTWNKLDLTKDGQVFSEEFGIAFFEDTDLSFRASEIGIGFRLVPIPVIHFGHITAHQLGVSELYQGAKRIFTDKWSGRV